MRQRTVLILANGDWDALSRLRSAARGSDFTIAADGAWAKACAYGIPVDLVIGDLDSLTPDEQTALMDSGTAVEAYPADKDWTDLELAIGRAVSERPTEILVFGAFGGRTDHTLASVFLLERGLEAGIPIRLLRGEETLYLVDDVLDVTEAAVGDRVSILPMSETACVTTQGLQYPLNREILFRSASRGVSNVAAASCPRVEIHTGRVLVLHATGDSEVAG